MKFLFIFLLGLNVIISLQASHINDTEEQSTTQEETDRRFKVDSNVTIKTIDTAETFKPQYLYSFKPSEYIVKQPIKEMCRWVGILNGVIGTTSIFNIISNDGSGLSIQDNALDYQFLIIGASGTVIGMPIGVYKGMKYNHNYKNGKLKVFRESILSTEWKVINKSKKISILFFLNYKKDLMFFDSILFGSVSSDYGNIINYGWENKVYFGLEDSYTFKRIFSLYYNICGGYSKGFYTSQYTDKKSIKHNFATVGHLGFKFNIFDLCYFKLEGEYEYSPFFTHLQSLIGNDEYISSNEDNIDELPTKLNYDIGIVVGIDIF